MFSIREFLGVIEEFLLENFKDNSTCFLKRTVLCPSICLYTCRNSRATEWGCRRFDLGPLQRPLYVTNRFLTSRTKVAKVLTVPKHSEQHLEIGERTYHNSHAVLWLGLSWTLLLIRVRKVHRGNYPIYFYSHTYIHRNGKICVVFIYDTVY
jgi:hypothetical protein